VHRPDQTGKSRIRQLPAINEVSSVKYNIRPFNLIRSGRLEFLFRHQKPFNDLVRKKTQYGNMKPESRWCRSSTNTFPRPAFGRIQSRVINLVKKSPAGKQYDTSTIHKPGWLQCRDSQLNSNEPETNQETARIQFMEKGIVQRKYFEKIPSKVSPVAS